MTAEAGTRRELFTPALRGGAALCLLLVVVIAHSAARKLGDPDLWWHLKTGAIIAATGEVPRTDPYSYSAFGKPWTAHEWLSELVFHGIWRAAGWGGILWFRALMLAAVVTAMFFLLRRRSGSFVVAVLLTTGVVLATSSFWSERPQLFTYLFLAGLIGVLDRAAGGRRRLLWVIPPAMVLWANLHGGFFAAYLVMGTVWLGTLIDARLGTDAGRDPAKLLRPLFLVGLLSVAAACLNPQGPEILLYPLRYVTEKGLATYVSEWQAPNARDSLGRLCEVLLLALLGLGMGSRLRLPWRETLPLLVFAHMALTAVRHIPIFGLLATYSLAGAWPVMAATLEGQVGRWPGVGRLWAQVERERDRPGSGVETAGSRALAALLVLIGLATCWARAPKENTFAGMVKESAAPIAAGRWIQAHVPPGRVFNDYDFGGYLIYLPRQGQAVTAVPPPWRVFIDGREDVYGGARMKEYFDQVVSGGPRWREMLDGPFAANYVVWAQKAPLTQLLENLPREWEKVYPPPGSGDKTVVIFRRRQEPVRDRLSGGAVP